MAVDPGNESVVVAHRKIERCNRAGICNDEWYADVGRGIVVLHQPLHIQADVGCGDSSVQPVIDVADICGRQLGIVEAEVVNQAVIIF